MTTLNFLHMGQYLERFDKRMWTTTSFEYHTGKPYYSLFMEKPLKELGIEVNILPFDQIDKNRPWFVNLNILTHNWGDEEGQDMYNDWPEELMEELINGQAYLIVNNENEYETTQAFKQFHFQYDKNPKIPSNKIFYLSPAYQCKDIYKNVTESLGIRSNLIKVIYVPHVDMLCSDSSIELSNRMKFNEIRSKKYISLNRMLRFHRPVLIGLLENLGCLTDGHVSLGINQNDKNNFQLHGGIKPYISRSIKSFPIGETEIHIRDRSLNGLENLYNKLPLVLDQEEFETNYAPWEFIPWKHVEDSYFSVVCSTHFFKWQEISLGWNEKEWRPLLYGHPFIIANRPHTLKVIRQFGFLTFNKWFDESYDDIEDDWQRLDAIAKEVNRLSKISAQEWDLMFKDMAITLNYNKHMLINNRWYNVFYGSDLKELIKWI